ncbi:MAG: FKBP-type peptidyl-prolyl cis-trans isomerase [Gemmatimonadota bacterium]|nr:FKBP-type peptidyl-prolyl cis-trans isomerase [Gemmatimonadota bacterium]
MKESRRRVLGAAGLLIAVTAPMACGDDMTGPESIERAQFAASLGINLAAFTRTSSGLYYEDIAPGSGEPAASGQSVRVAYTGWLTNGTQFDSGEFAFLLGAGQVVPGFDEGVQGMRVGGIRRIIIPPELGYGNRGSGPVPPNAIMIFRIEVLSIG